MLNLGLRRTKIVCTIGPSTDSPEMIARLIEAGMNVARLNFSHGTHETHAKTLRLIREIAEQKGIPVGVLQDLSGPKIRIGKMKQPVLLQEGAAFTLYKDEREGDETGVSCNYPDLILAAEPDDTILLADGQIILKVEHKFPDRLECRVVEGGLLSSHKGINLPGRSLPIPCITEKDRRDIKFAVKHRVDFLALSFVRKPGDVLKLKNMLHRMGVSIPVIAKIEKHEALEAIEEIISVSDGIMVARGDLAVETPLEKVPLEQKRIIALCNEKGKPVITATQMLKSMVEDSRPTRAEVADVANAVLDGTDAVMLSEETTVGKYPLEAVKTMHRILLASEKSLEPRLHLKLKNTDRLMSVPAGVSHAAVVMAHDLKASAIITPTRRGTTVRLVSRFRPRVPIVALCVDDRMRKQMTLVWGVYPYLATETNETDAVFNMAKETAKANGFSKPGDRVIITAGLPLGTRGKTNLIKVDEIE